MLIDLREQTANTNQITTDICIVGAGAVGITLALELEKSGVGAVLLEGGGLDFPTDPTERDLYDAKVGEKSYPIATSRLRLLGGSTNHWGGWSRKLDPFDFASKPYFPESGWPFDRPELDPYYQIAAKIVEIPNFDKSFDGYYERTVTDNVIDWGQSPFKNKFFVFSPPTRFGKKYRPELDGANHVTTYLHANATSLLIEGNRVLGVTAKSLNGNTLTVRCRDTILAMGGLEIPRFMLNQRTQAFPNGIGNSNDWLGRCFMDHPGFGPISLLLPEGLTYNRVRFEDQPVMPVLSMSDSALFENRLNNFCITLRRIKDDDLVTPDSATAPWFSSIGQRAFGTYSAQFIFEPSPCRDSRVTLVDDADIFGIRKLKLNWQFNHRDFRSVERVIDLLIRYLGVSGFGRVQWHRQFDPQTIKRIGGAMHHAGTTRMAVSANDGVVDANCKVHDAEGLYVMGNSVFPTVGFSNPTITIVALSLRLARHLRGGPA